MLAGFGVLTKRACKLEGCNSNRRLLVIENYQCYRSVDSSEQKSSSCFDSLHGRLFTGNVMIVGLCEKLMTTECLSCTLSERFINAQVLART